MHDSPLWQSLVTLLIVAAAAIYLGRRWWPSLASLLGLESAKAAANKAACGQPGGACKQCGSSGATPQRDHRIHIVPRRK